MATRARTARVWMAAVGLVGAVAACEPHPPRPSLVVTSTAPGADANPGDGICEVTVGVGDCTLPAAVDEANALGQADIDLPAGVYVAMDLTVTGGIRINPDGPTRGIGLRGVTMTVALGGALILDGVHVAVSPADTSTPFTNFVVDGTLVLRRSSVIGFQTVVDVHPGATAAFDNSIVGGLLGINSGVILNEGTVVVRHSFILGGDSPVLATRGAGVTRVTASVLIATRFRVDPQPVCAGTAPVSGGYNVASDATCALSGPGDLQNTTATFEETPPVGNDDFFAVVPAVGSPAIDRVPVGTAGCGIEVTQDYYQGPRPVDGDGDALAACDSGPGERPAP